MSSNRHKRALLLAAAMVLIIATSMRLRADTGTCGGVSITLPFTDVPSSNVFFCSIAEAYFAGLTNGTTSTSYSPSANVPREQMAAFVTRTMDQSVGRSSRRAALGRFWTPQNEFVLTRTAVGGGPLRVKSDGLDLWVANANSGTVSRVRASDGSKVGSDWTGAENAGAVLVAIGRVFVTGLFSPAGKLYVIDPSNQNGGPVNAVIAGLGSLPSGISFDGARVWTSNGDGSVSFISFPSFSVMNVSPGVGALTDILFDGHDMWVTDGGSAKLRKLNSDGSIALSISVGASPRSLAFDGINIWVSSASDNSITVVRAKDAAGNPLAQPIVVATLTGNGLTSPAQIAFDGERMLVTNQFGSSVSLWKATDLTPIGTFPTGTGTTPIGACSDGLNFWITLLESGGPGGLARF